MLDKFTRTTEYQSGPRISRQRADNSLYFIIFWFFLTKQEAQIQPPAVPKRTVPPLTATNLEQQPKKMVRSQQPPAVPPRTRTLPPLPPPETKPRPAQTVPSDSAPKSNIIQPQAPSYHMSKIPPAPAGPPPPAPKINHKPPSQVNKSTAVQQYNVNKVSVRQDSSVSSDSFSQTSSPSYTTKTMETPLLPPRTPLKQNGVLIKNHMEEVEANGNGTITKSASTPASLQTIVRFHNGSNMSLHHRVSKRKRCRYKFVLLRRVVLATVSNFTLSEIIVTHFDFDER